MVSVVLYLVVPWTKWYSPKGGDTGAGAREGLCVQDSMLARIVVKIRSADLAVELEP
jgi:hypothetical protein